MAFDQETRNLLQRIVSACRGILDREFTAQLQELYGIQPDGNLTRCADLDHLDDEGLEVARLLRSRINHLEGGAPAEALTRTQARPEHVARVIREQAFTVLNRLAALRLCEERGLVLECVRKGVNSEGFKLFLTTAGNALGETHEAYRVYLRCVFDELALDLGVVFDQFSPLALLFPRKEALDEVLRELNGSGKAAESKAIPAEQFADIWKADEAIGWIYQYYNDEAERKKMRKDSSAPRNSRELAIRNQFFTPRYVVEFLTDNTLGRLWYEMRRGESALRTQSRYLVRRAHEIFLKTGEPSPDQPKQTQLSQEELLKRPVYIPHRMLKDPREIRLLDPACGSMHFGLYAFDLFTAIYDEAWDIVKSGSIPADADPSFAHFVTLVSTFPAKEDFLRHVPRLIVECNIHGIDIDPRATQIAGLSLWLRAQRAWHQAGVKPADRPRITRSNLVCAEPMPGEKMLLREFVEQQFPPSERPAFAFLLEKIFDHMALAGEAGSLLRIEEEIRAAIAEASALAQSQSAPRQKLLFSGEKRSEQAEFDLRGLNDEQFWQRAEQRIYDALEAYAAKAENGGGFQRRLFANDAAQGFAFIDLCRKRYEVVVMNPPFGEPSKQVPSRFFTNWYPKTKHDMFAAFTERILSMLTASGLMGQLSSRVGFFIKSFESWRRELVGRHSVSVIADLGFGVLDSAAVEAAAYVVENRPAQDNDLTVVYRLLTVDQKGEALQDCLLHSSDERRFVFQIEQCSCLPLAPWVYWVSRETREKLAKPERLEPKGALVRQGLGTGNNSRFIRALWEAPPSLISTKPGEGDPFSLQFSQGKRWAPHVRSGSSQPWYSPLTVLIDWENQGLRLKEHWRSQGESPSRYIPSEELYFRPGFSWTLRAFRLIPYVIPAGCIPSASRYMCFPNEGEESAVLGFAASNIASAFMRFYGEMFERPKHLVDTLKRLPYVTCSSSLAKTLASHIANEVKTRRMFFRNFEPFWDFVLPSAIKQWSQDESSNWNPLSLLGEATEIEVATSLGLSPVQVTEVEYDLRQAVQVRRRGSNSSDSDADESEDDDSSCDTSEYGKTVDLVSYLFGCVHGRWDIRYATGERVEPELPDPFAPLPVCPPGMLQGEDGLPLSPEAGCRLRTERRYPLDVVWDGILVDDPDHPLDLERLVQAALTVLWAERADTRKHEACALLGVPTLREWFRRPTGFFADHLKRYSKSRRQAPLYWPLSTSSGRYTLWLYYHRLTSDTLYKCIQQFVAPKLAGVEKENAHLRSVLASNDGGGKERKRLEELEDIRRELIALRTELELWAPKWKPNLNDGVFITAAPLWKLFRLPKWQKDLKACWQELEKGEYDWAHLAYDLWPGRVREKCKTDRSLAIAHGLEAICTVTVPTKKMNKKKVAPASEPELELE